MKRVARFVAGRLLWFVPAALGVSLVVFGLVRLVPGDPARQLSGPLASEAGVERLREKMGLTEPLPVQYWNYLTDLVRGDFGFSWFNNNDVLDDLLNRFPATLELITLSLGLAILIALPLGVIVARGRSRRTRFLRGGVRAYGLLAGSLPDFWVALLLLYLFFHVLGIAPPPLGRLALGEVAPERITGFYTFDSLITGRLDLFVSAVKHLLLPVATLTFVYGSLILKMTVATLREVDQREFMAAARVLGLKKIVLIRYALRNALPPIVTTIAVTYGFLIGGAVLVETIFSWGGIGQYGVHAVVNSDYMAIQGFVLFTAVFALAVYLVLDVLYFLIDPRAV